MDVNFPLDQWRGGRRILNFVNHQRDKKIALIYISCMKQIFLNLGVNEVKEFCCFQLLSCKCFQLLDVFLIIVLHTQRTCQPDVLEKDGLLHFHLIGAQH